VQFQFVHALKSAFSRAKGTQIVADPRKPPQSSRKSPTPSHGFLQPTTRT
jgi:hypothetical protein